MVADLGDFIRVWIMMSLLLLAPTLECAPGFPPVRADLEAGATEDEETLPLRAEPAAVPRGASFETLDHELARAGGYGVRPAAKIVSRPEFDVVDHELAYVGGYGLSPIAGVVSGAEFDFVDHELAHAGGYGLIGIAGIEPGPVFDFLDHELAYAGDYGLCAVDLALR